MNDIVLKTKSGKTLSMSVDKSDNIQSLEIEEIIEFKVTDIGEGDKTIKIRALPSINVMKILKYIEDAHGITEDDARLVCNGRTVRSGTLHENGIINNSIIFMCAVQRGS